MEQNCEIEVFTALNIFVGHVLMKSDRQHLERTHCAPIQCRRCWQDFLNEAALTDHSRSAQQCPILPQGPVESIPLHKWDIIKSRWGATWNFIFGILFPSVTIPSCCGCPFQSFHRQNTDPSTQITMTYHLHRSYHRHHQHLKILRAMKYILERSFPD
jgi:hypothetical protein